MDSPDSVRVHCPAKLNLWLEVLGRRPDGFHELDTGLVAIDLWDTVEVERRPGGAGALVLHVEGPRTSPDVPVGPDNLACRAAELVLERAVQLGHERPSLELRLTKAIPSQAGLGGGSSDAAGVAWACCLLLGLDPEDPFILDGLGQLGSDCTFFLRARDQGLARCLGRGEQCEVRPNPRTERVFALFTPEVGCSTAAVYGALDLASRTPFDVQADAWFSLALPRARASLVNHLEPAAEGLHPELARWRECLQGGGWGHFRLSGSGSSYYALFGNRAEAEAALQAVVAAGKDRNLGLRGAWVVAPAGCGLRHGPSK